MFRWIPFAMVRIVAFFVFGILAGIYQPDLIGQDLAKPLLLLFTALYGISYLFLRRSHKAIVGAIGLSAIMMAGYVHLLMFISSDRPSHLSQYGGDVIAYMATVIETPEEKSNSWKYTIEVEKINNGDIWLEKEAKVLLYIRKDSDGAKYFYGDKIIVRGKPQLLSPPQNPHEFNFKRFLGFKNIYHQQFAREDYVQLIEPIKSKDLFYYSCIARKWASHQLKAQLHNEKEQAIALALTLGVKDGIDNELQSAYAASGAMHVLAVSGLHVGILYGIVLLLLRPIRNLSWSRWLIAAISLVILWSFAFITGLSPSVLRAVTMFSFIALAKPFGRNTNIYNTLAGSAFLLLLFNPYLVMSVGFQLSYLAVLGIVSLHSMLYRLWEPKSLVLDWVWNISCVSIAAQLATFSLGILYFHQFPVYFLFSNLFVIPGAISVLVMGILVIVSGALPGLANLLGGILQWLIQVLNYGVFTIEKLPFSLVEDIYITTFQCWLLIAALIFLVLMVSYRRLSYLVTASVFIVIFSITQWYHYLNDVRGNRFIVYNIPGHVGIEWISNGKSMFLADSLLLLDSERMRFHVRPNRLFCGVKVTESLILDEHSSGIRVFSKNGKVFGVLNKMVPVWPDELKLDYLVAGINSNKPLASVKNTINFEKLIFDSRYSSFFAGRTNSDSLDVYSVQDSGAFVEKF